MALKIYVAASGQHVGKTTSTLGLVANLKALGLKVGYCKPMGQQFLTVDGKTADKDAVLFAKMLGFKIIPEIHSPVIFGRGATTKYLDNPENFNFEQQVLDASKKLEGSCDIVVYEGTGHPGVGSIVGLSNAHVAKILEAGVVMVVEGGIGSTIDRLNLSLALFREEKVPIIGVIVNKVIEDKIERVSHYLSKKLKQMDIPLLGILPYDPTLSFPIMSTVCHAVKGQVRYFSEKMDNKVENILAGSLIDAREFTSTENNLLVVSVMRLHEAIQKVQEITQAKQIESCPLSGVLITGDGRHENWIREENMYNNYLQKHRVPVITTNLDTFGSVVKISRIEVKINTHTPWKVKRAIELINQHVDLEKFSRI